MARGKGGPSGTDLKQYQMTSMETKESKDLLERFAMSSLSGKQQMTQELATKLRSLTGMNTDHLVGEDIGEN